LLTRLFYTARVCAVHSVPRDVLSGVKRERKVAVKAVLWRNYARNRLCLVARLLLQ